MRPTHHTFSTNRKLSGSGVVPFQGGCLQAKAKSRNPCPWSEAVFCGREPLTSGELLSHFGAFVCGDLRVNYVPNPSWLSGWYCLWLWLLGNLTGWVV